MNLVPFYIAAIAVLMLASAVWRYRQRDMIGNRHGWQNSTLIKSQCMQPGQFEIFTEILGKSAQ
ncbi:hypothetical protein LJR234_004605 [Mesorhizobium amorphae]|uniref:hypothetical protein n=1 Tax=Mesorhizobium amorphae TaxID=71433 RepID=UPI003ECEA5FC